MDFEYKLRLPAAFISAFVISVSVMCGCVGGWCVDVDVWVYGVCGCGCVGVCAGVCGCGCEFGCGCGGACLSVRTLHPFLQGIVHPAVAKLIWTDHRNSLSPFRYCTYPWLKDSTPFPCNSTLYNYYILDFAGGGAVHLLG